MLAYPAVLEVAMATAMVQVILEMKVPRGMRAKVSEYLQERSACLSRYTRLYRIARSV